MKVELSLLQLQTIHTVLMESQGPSSYTDWFEELIEQAQELEELDLDDCSSGACRL